MTFFFISSSCKQDRQLDIPRFFIGKAFSFDIVSCDFHDSSCLSDVKNIGKSVGNLSISFTADNIKFDFDDKDIGSLPIAGIFSGLRSMKEFADGKTGINFLDSPSMTVHSLETRDLYTNTYIVIFRLDYTKDGAKYFQALRLGFLFNPDDSQKNVFSMEVALDTQIPTDPKVYSTTTEYPMGQLQNVESLGVIFVPK